ncbi:MAG: hypothetical protein ACLQJF_06980 [Candidatus Sulfotelmatobacter sp.]|jgi:predicted DNA-binding WGR domain protein
MLSLEYCIEHAPELAQEIVNEWGRVTSTGNAGTLTSDFKLLSEQACQYQAVKRDTDYRREAYTRSSKDRATDKELQAFLEQDAAKDRAEREVFAKAYKKFRDAHEVS